MAGGQGTHSLRHAARGLLRLRGSGLPAADAKVAGQGLHVRGAAVQAGGCPGRSPLTRSVHNNHNGKNDDNHNGDNNYYNNNKSKHTRGESERYLMTRQNNVHIFGTFFLQHSDVRTDKQM